MIWKQILHYDKYEVNEEGEVRKISTKRLIKQNIDKYGKTYCVLYRNQKGEKIRLSNEILKEIFNDNIPEQIKNQASANRYEWKSLDKKYEICVEGFVRHKKTKRFLKKHKNSFYEKYPHYYYILHQKKITLHWLLASAFIEKPYPAKKVIHKDGNSLNNSLDNLKWEDLIDEKKTKIIRETVYALYGYSKPEDIPKEKIKEIVYKFNEVSYAIRDNIGYCNISFKEALQFAICQLIK